MVIKSEFISFNSPNHFSFPKQQSTTATRRKSECVKVVEKMEKEREERRTKLQDMKKKVKLLTSSLILYGLCFLYITMSLRFLPVRYMDPLEAMDCFVSY